MLALGIALIVIALLSTMSVPTFIVWLFGIGALGFWMGKEHCGTSKENGGFQE